MTPGTVLLFYRYYAGPPLLSPHPNPKTLQSFHTALATPLGLTGKLRLANEGFNVTIAGPTTSIKEYITACISHISFAGLPLNTPASQNAFFKPTPGCSCIFPNLSIRICDEITPMAVTAYTPKDWIIVTEIEPKDWHDLLTSPSQDELTLLDVRNHYESSLGHFISASGRHATRPPIRRFSQFPLYVRKRGVALLSPSPSLATSVDEPPEKEKQPQRVLSYCTGGIRCEKASRFMAETLALSPSTSTSKFQICTLRGGIAAYLTWIDAEIRSGRLTAADSVFKGRNYVFDARGSIGFADGGEEIVGRCVRCGELGDKMRKCGSRGCRLEVVVCARCEREEVVCCADCRDIETGSDRGMNGTRGMCQCEKDREARLWGDDPGQKAQRKQGWKQKKRREERMVSEKNEKVNIQVRLIQPERGLIQ
jgi:predicted sulfurtransferase